MEINSDARFKGINKLNNRVWLSSPTMHNNEQKWVDEAIQTNWVSTIGTNINEVEKMITEYVGCKYAVGLSCGTSALHLAIRLAGEKLYGKTKPNSGTLYGKRVFCSDVTFDASVNPIAYEGGEAVFIDTEPETWNMCPEALKQAFNIYPDVRLVVIAHLYGTPGKMQEIINICESNNAIVIEDAAESLGAKYKLNNSWMQTGILGNYGCISFNGNKIITGSCGGMFLTNSFDDAEKVRKWSTQSRENAPWYQHEEVGYNYRMSNVIAGIIRGQIPYLDEHIKRKEEIYQKYKKGFRDLPIKMNPYIEEISHPNFWLSCITIDEEFLAPMERSDNKYLYHSVGGKTSPHEILDVLNLLNIEGRPIWKPMHMQPIYRMNPFITKNGNGRGTSNAYSEVCSFDVGSSIFQRGLCLPSDIKMTEYEQDLVIDVIHRCFL